MSSGRAPCAARLLAVVALLLVPLGGCSEEDAQRAVDRAADDASSAIDQAELPEVDWQQYSGEVRNRLDKLVDQADCAGLQRELTKAEGSDTALARYIKAALRELDC